MLTPRRHRRPSSTPQNTLRILSRALAKEKQPDVTEDIDQDEAEQRELSHEETNKKDHQSFTTNQDFALEQDIDFDFQEDLDKQYENQITDPQQQWVVDDGDDDIEDRRRLSLRHSERFSQQALSDIALPVGIMPDESIDAAPFSDTFQFDVHPESEVLHNSQSVINTKDLLIRPNIPSKKLEKTVKKLRLQTTDRVKNPTNNRRITKYAQTFTKKSLSKQAIKTLHQTTELFFNQVSDDLQAYTKHSKNKEVINIRSVFLLLKRQRQVDSIDSLLDLVEEILPLEQVLEIRKHINKLST